MEKIAALEDAISKKSLVGIYSVFYTIAHGDPNFSTNKFRNVLEYVKTKNISGLLQEFDGEDFEPEEKWDEDYWALVASSLIDNFCEERIQHLEIVGKKVYPLKASEENKSPCIDIASSNAAIFSIISSIFYISKTASNCAKNFSSHAAFSFSDSILASMLL